MPEALLQLENIKKYFPIKKGLLRRTVGYVKAVDDVTLTVYKGETLGVVGESGSGKSTLGRTAIRLLEATGGKVLFDGEDLSRLTGENRRSLKRDMQIIFQDPYGSLNPRFRVREILAEPLIAHGEADGDMAGRIGALLDDVGLSRDYVNRFPHEFSGGQRQRISIARALALRPRFIVCDEAVSALDVSTQSQVLNLLKELQQKYGLTYLFISHNIGVVNFISHRVAVMYLGRIVEVAEADEIYHNPLHPYTKALFSAIPEPDPLLKKQRIILPGDVPSPANPPGGCGFHPRCDRCRDRCKRESPCLEEQGNGHLVSCFYPETTSHEGKDVTI